MDYHAQRIIKEKSAVRSRIWAIDFSLLFYLFAGSFYLVSRCLEWGEVLRPFTGKALLGSGILSLVLAFLWLKRGFSLGQILIYRTNPVLKGVKSLRRDFYWTSLSGIACSMGIALTFVLGYFLTEVSFYNLFSYEGLLGARRIFVSLFQPNLGIIEDVLEAMIETIFIAFMATFIALPISFTLSFFCARNLMKKSSAGMWIYNLIRLMANFTRSVEPLIWAIIFSVWVGIGPFAGMLALMLHSVASLVKLYSEQIESINQGPMEAMEATGANSLQVIWYAVVPQIILPYLSFTIYRWDINIRMATIIGLVGGGGVGTLLMQYQGLAQWNEVGTIVLVIAIVVWTMDYLSAKIREAIY